MNESQKQELVNQLVKAWLPQIETLALKKVNQILEFVNDNQSEMVKTGATPSIVAGKVFEKLKNERLILKSDWKDFLF